MARIRHACVPNPGHKDRWRARTRQTGRAMGRFSSQCPCWRCRPPVNDEICTQSAVLFTIRPCLGYFLSSADCRHNSARCSSSCEERLRNAPGTPPRASCDQHRSTGRVRGDPSHGTSAAAGAVPRCPAATGEEGYEQARRFWNGAIDRRPALIARCVGSDDVVAAVRFARDHDLLVSVRGGGHAAGHAACDDGLMIDLSLMKSITVDPASSTTLTASTSAVLTPGTSRLVPALTSASARRSLAWKERSRYRLSPSGSWTPPSRLTSFGTRTASPSAA